MATKLTVLAPYLNVGPMNLSYRDGEIIEVSDELAKWLMADAPGCFAVAPEPKAMDTPPVDKMVRTPKAKK